MNITRRLAIAFALSILSLCFAGSTTAHAQQTFTVTPQGMQAYLINGAANPTLTLARGQTYQFLVNSAGHPFFIKTQAGTGTGNQFSEGVTNNGTTSGALQFTVPADAPNNLFYQCSIHSAMTGSILVVNAAAVPASTSPFVLLGLAALGLIFLFRLRRPNRSAGRA